MTEKDMTAVRLATARAWAQASAVRRAFFDAGETLFVDPAWDILLALYIAEAEGGTVAATGACAIASVPATTGLRWLKRLSIDGLIEYAGDNPDGGTILSLTDNGLARMVAALDAAIEGNARLGLGRVDLGQ